jgi:hypothetical protein
MPVAKIWPCTYSVGELPRLNLVTAFQSDSDNSVSKTINLAVRGPERFRGGCAFGVITTTRRNNSPAGICHLFYLAQDK